MVDAGIKINEAAVKSMQDVVLHKSRWAIAKFNARCTEVIVDCSGDKNSTFKELMENIPQNEVRFIAYDCKYKIACDGRETKKVLFVAWSNDEGTNAKQKMCISGTCHRFATKIVEIKKRVTINSWDELTEDNFIDLVSDNRTK